MVWVLSGLAGGMAALVSFLQYPASLWRGLTVLVVAYGAVFAAGYFLSEEGQADLAIGFSGLAVAAGLVAVLSTALLRLWWPRGRVVALVGFGMGLLVFAALTTQWFSIMSQIYG